MLSKEEIEKEISRELTVLGHGFSDLSYCELIERWQNAYKSVLNSHLDLYAENERLKAELENYKEALENILESFHKTFGVGPEYNNCPSELVMDAYNKLYDEKQVELEKAEQWINDLHSGMYINCVYCGHRYGPRENTPVSMADVLKKHIEQCPKHPLKKERELRHRAEAELEAIKNPIEIMFDDFMKSLTWDASEYQIRKEIWTQAYLLGIKKVDTKTEEKLAELRKLLWLRHGCSINRLYGDDGEMQCNSCMIDFKRDSLEVINKRFKQQAEAALEEAKGDNENESI
jgi:hypothetical protein